MGRPKDKRDRLIERAQAEIQRALARQDGGGAAEHLLHLPRELRAEMLPALVPLLAAEIRRAAAAGELGRLSQWAARVESEPRLLSGVSAGALDAVGADALFALVVGGLRAREYPRAERLLALLTPYLRDRGPRLLAWLQALVALFAGAKVPVTVSPDVIGELWSKLMVNCAYNAISALAQQPYGRMAALPAIREVQHAVVREVVAVAQADGQSLTLPAALEAMERIATAMPGQFSSTAQDLARGKPTEIDHLNGFVARRGAELGIATPVNQTLHALVKLVEAGRAAPVA